MIRLFNTMSKEVEPFVPSDPERVTLYCCGPTVYGPGHIGNARPAVIVDVLYRLLMTIYGRNAVTYVRNYTDIDDKIMETAEGLQIDIHALTRGEITRYEQECMAMEVLPPDYRPRATDHVAEMIKMISRLLELGHAYEAEHHVLFSVSSYQGPTLVPNRSPNDVEARIAASSYKRDPRDFVLWKPSTDEQPGWTSPWGRGRPGWHIECSAFIEKHIGETVDIHCGGQDLIFPHHEAEIMQSSCAHGGAPLARHWLHNGMVTINGAKMSKSTGNFITVDDILYRGYPGEAIRYVLLGGHYSQPLDFTWEKLDQAVEALDGLYGALRGSGAVFEWHHQDLPKAHDGVLSALLDDLNTPKALAELHEMAARVNRAEMSGSFLFRTGYNLGLFRQGWEMWFQGAIPRDEWPAVKEMIDLRNQAREQRMWDTADEYRRILAAKRITLEDQHGVTFWRARREIR